ncbi:MAG: hypothetical protein ACXAC5_01030 [Promethearchaeota archaeon]|jgi:hypothetical protein
MNIDAKKVNILEGAWVSSDYYTSVYPRFEQSKIPVFRQQILPLTHLHDDEFWWELRSTHRIDVAIPDFRHWLFEDDIFDHYVERITSVRFPVFCLFESPFGYEMPKIDREVFAKKLFERTSCLATAIREKHPETILLSPAIAPMKEEHRNQYLDYFIHNRQFFDGYAVHCCNDMREHTLGQMSALLNQVMDVLPKRLWITKWAVPCFDGKIVNPQVMGPSGWEPYQFNQAGQRLLRSFSLVDSIARSGSHWFYVGTGRDFYKPRRLPGPQEFWQTASSPVIPEEYSYGWQYWHFLGMLTADGQLKTKLIDSFLKFASKQNG